MFKRIKQLSLSILPIVAFVLVLHFGVQKFDNSVLINFLVGTVIFVIGQAIFLTGLDSSIVPMGEYVGNSVNDQRRFYIYIIFGLVFGIVSTIAEPDLQVFSTKVVLGGFSIPKIWLMLGAGLGVGLCLALGLVRIVKSIPYNLLLILLFAVIGVFIVFTTDGELSVSLDVAASTTGVVTCPFLLAFGIGIAKIVSHKNSSKDDNFGLIGLSSIGPIIIVLLLSVIFKDSSASVGSDTAKELPLWLETLKDVSLSLLPLVVVFFIFEFFFIKISRQEKKKLLLGSLVTFVGFYMFLFGAELGFSEMGVQVGKVINGFDNIWLTIIICSLLSFTLVFSEPSIRIFAKEIEDVTNRNIRAWLILVAIGLSVLVSTVMIILKIYFSIPMWILFAVCYGLVLVLSFFVDKMFTAIAFDSSGVATGTLTVAFVFPIMIGIGGGSEGSFGTLGIMVMFPTLVMELIGLVFTIIVKSDDRKTRKILLKLSRTDDKYSNIDKIREKHQREYGGGDYE